MIYVFLFNPVYDLLVWRHLGVSHCFSGYVCDGALRISATLGNFVHVESLTLRFAWTSCKHGDIILSIELKLFES